MSTIVSGHHRHAIPAKSEDDFPERLHGFRVAFKAISESTSLPMGLDKSMPTFLVAKVSKLVWSMSMDQRATVPSVDYTVRTRTPYDHGVSTSAQIILSNGPRYLIRKATCYWDESVLGLGGLTTRRKPPEAISTASPIANLHLAKKSTWPLSYLLTAA